MLVKDFKKAVLVLAAVITAASAAMAAPTGSRLVGGKTSGGDESFERELEGGIKVVVNSVERLPHYYISVKFIVTTEEDMIIKVGGTTLYDNEGNEFNQLNTILIGNQNVKERMLIAGVPTVVALQYNVDSSYKVASTYPRVGIIINGTTLNFRNVPGKQQ
ncbi:MAG: hypothetical protein LBC93_05975 [Synergistaceae bacterium]|nr:hypothetical protein [Synergistaceae bacterium]